MSGMPKHNLSPPLRRRMLWEPIAILADEPERACIPTPREETRDDTE